MFTWIIETNMMQIWNHFNQGKSESNFSSNGTLFSLPAVDSKYEDDGNTTMMAMILIKGPRHQVSVYVSY